MKQEELRKKLFRVNNHVKTCEHKFKASDVCLNGKACTEKIKATILGSKQAATYNIDCKCPLKFSFKCGSNYCTRDLEACHYLKLNPKVNKYIHSNLKGCGNGGISTIRPFISWSG